MPFGSHRLQDLQGFDYTIQSLLQKRLVGPPSHIRVVKGFVQRFDTVDDCVFSSIWQLASRKIPLVKCHSRIPVAGSNTVVDIHVVIVLSFHYVGEYRIDHITHWVKETEIFSARDHKAQTLDGVRSVRHILSFCLSQNNLSSIVSANLIRVSRFYPKFGMMRKGRDMRLARLSASNVTYLSECLRVGIFG